MAAVQKDGRSLEHAHEEMKKDKEVVMAAVQNNGNALQYAHEEMKKDKEVVMAAVQNLGGALRHAAAEIEEELTTEAECFNITPHEYAMAAAHPIIIQLFLSESNDLGGYA